MLKYFFDYQLIHYPDKEITNWREAIAESCRVLIDKKIIDQTYVEEIIHCVEKYGPYIVIAPNIAMPHSQEGAKGVHKTEIAFMKLKKPVSFEEGNPELDAQLFFTLAACNNEQHLQNMSRLSEMLMNEELVEELADVETEEDLLKLQEKYLDA